MPIASISMPILYWLICLTRKVRGSDGSLEERTYKEAFDEGLVEYYKLMVFDETRVPKIETLVELGLMDVEEVKEWYERISEKWKWSMKLKMMTNTIWY